MEEAGELEKASGFHPASFPYPAAPRSAAPVAPIAPAPERRRKSRLDKFLRRPSLTNSSAPVHSFAVGGDDVTGAAVHARDVFPGAARNMVARPVLRFDEVVPLARDYDIAAARISEEVVVPEAAGDDGGSLGGALPRGRADRRRPSGEEHEQNPGSGEDESGEARRRSAVVGGGGRFRRGGGFLLHAQWIASFGWRDDSPCRTGFYGRSGVPWLKEGNIGLKFSLKPCRAGRIHVILCRWDACARADHAPGMVMKGRETP